MAVRRTKSEMKSYMSHLNYKVNVMKKCKNKFCNNEHVKDKVACLKHLCKNPKCNSGYIMDNWQVYCGKCMIPPCKYENCDKNATICMVSRGFFCNIHYKIALQQPL